MIASIFWTIYSHFATYFDCKAECCSWLSRILNIICFTDKVLRASLSLVTLFGLSAPVIVFTDKKTLSANLGLVTFFSFFFRFWLLTPSEFHLWDRITISSSIGMYLPGR